MRILKISFIFLILILFGCPPHPRTIWFKFNGDWVKKSRISKEGINIKVNGLYYPYKLNFNDEIGIFIEITPQIELLKDDIKVESDRFNFDKLYTPTSESNGFCIFLKDHCTGYYDMTPTEFANFIDSTYLKVTIINLLKEPFNFEINYDREFLKREFNTIMEWRAKNN